MYTCIGRFMKVSVIGTGYVGLVTATCLAYLGHELACLDINEERINDLQEGKVPIYEPGLEDLLAEIRKKGNYPTFTTDAKEAIQHGEVVFIAVGTPSQANGEPNLTYLQSAAETIGKYLNEGTVVVNKSTVPVGSGNWVKMLVQEGVKQREAELVCAGAKAGSGTASNTSVDFFVASNPEFLREGSAIHDTLYPDRIVIGAERKEAGTKLEELYASLIKQDFKEPEFCKRPEGFAAVPFISTDVTSAEMIKYSANCFLPMKISFANQIANICDLVGADVNEVMKGIGTDSRIGAKFLNAGIGWGGSCFGKDVDALISIANDYGYDAEMLTAVKKVNYKQRDLIVKRLQEQMKIVKGKTIALLGLAFKPNTDDLRDAPALDIARALIKLGAKVKVVDPIAVPNCKKQNPDLNIEYSNSPEDLVQDADALVLVTEWDEYNNLDMAKLLSKMNGNLFIDGRNQYDPESLKSVGFNYVGLGRGH